MGQAGIMRRSTGQLAIMTRQMRDSSILAAVAVFLVAPALAGQAGSRRSQAEIAKALRSHDRDTVAHALAEVPLGYDPEDELGWKFPLDYVVTPELSAALISALDREARLHMDGCTVTGFEGNRHLELSLELLHFVIALRDTATIPAMVQMICSGGAVRQALFGFGPAIIPHLVAWARSPDAVRGDVTGSLFALSEAVDRWGETLSAESQASIKDVALLHFDPGSNRFPDQLEKELVLTRAITLASVLRDSELLVILEEIADESHEVLDGLDAETTAGLRDMARRGIAGPVWEIPRR